MSKNIAKQTEQYDDIGIFKMAGAAIKASIYTVFKLAEATSKVAGSADDLATLGSKTTSHMLVQSDIANEQERRKAKALLDEMFPEPTTTKKK